MVYHRNGPVPHKHRRGQPLAPPPPSKANESPPRRSHLVAASRSLYQATKDRVEKQAAVLMTQMGDAMKDTRVLSVREAAKARTRAQALKDVGLLELHLHDARDIGDVGMKFLGNWVIRLAIRLKGGNSLQAAIPESGNM